MSEPAKRFLDLHRPHDPLLLPNPWDAGSARLLASLGFKALATTSSGFAATLGRVDNSVTRAEALAHAAAIVAATPPAGFRGPREWVRRGGRGCRRDGAGRRRRRA